MNATNPSASIERRARRRVAMKTGYLTHLLVYVLVNAALQGFNAAIGGERWSVFPLMGWGLGLAIHGVVTFIALAGDGWRERMLEQEIERLRRRGQSS